MSKHGWAVRLNRIVRPLERKLYAAARSSHADDLRGEPQPWAADLLADHDCLLLVSFRRDGTPVPTPVWFGLSGDRAYARSEANDAKVARIRRNPNVLVAPCDLRGAPLGPAMRARARVLQDGESTRCAERAIVENIGLRRRAYDAFRAGWLEAAYLEVGPPTGGEPTE